MELLLLLLLLLLYSSLPSILGEDLLSWSLTKSGKFNVKLYYEALRGSR